jgi:hypothetical protein
MPQYVQEMELKLSDKLIVWYTIILLIRYNLVFGRSQNTYKRHETYENFPILEVSIYKQEENKKPGLVNIS